MSKQPRYYVCIKRSIEDRAEALVLGEDSSEYTIINSVVIGGISTLFKNTNKVLITNELYFDLVQLYASIPLHIIKSEAVYLLNYDPRRESPEQG